MANNPEIDIFAKLEVNQKNYLWKLIINAILATDMSMHFSIIKGFKELISSAIQTSDPKFWIDKDERRFELISNLIHSVDISASSCISD